MIEQIRHLAWRSLLKTIRQPALIVPPIVFPLILLAVNTAGLDATTKLPGFPTDNYIDFAVAFALLQGSLFAMINAGMILAGDVQTGFLKRLALTPMQRTALLLGNLAGILLVSFVSTFLYLVVGFASGMHVDAGVGGVLVIVALATIIALAFAAVGALVGLRAGNAEAVQGFFPLFFVLLFLSSMSLPRNFMDTDWFRTVATWNPISYMVEGVRAPIIFGWDWEAIGLGFGISAALLIGASIGASRALRTRLVRT